MTTVYCLQLASAGAALAAGALWFWSVKVAFPDRYTINVVRPDEGLFGPEPMGGTFVGQAYSSDFKRLTSALATQSKRNSYAALAAGLSAILQAVSLLVA